MQNLRTLALFAAALALAGCGAVPQVSRQSQAPATAPRPVVVNEEARMCLANLGQTGSRFVPLPDRYYGGGCSAVGAVQLSAVQGDEAPMSVSNIGPVTCNTAQTFTGWARYGVDRAARQILGSPLQRIETMGSYACRNVAGTSRRSAHSQAAAVDVSAFILEDGRRISVAQAWQDGSAQERAFLRTVHNSACKRFGTVLGPDYNAAHRDHFHLEQGDGSYCR